MEEKYYHKYMDQEYEIEKKGTCAIKEVNYRDLYELETYSPEDDKLKTCSPEDKSHHEHLESLSEFYKNDFKKQDNNAANYLNQNKYSGYFKGYETVALLSLFGSSAFLLSYISYNYGYGEYLLANIMPEFMYNLDISHLPFHHPHNVIGEVMEGAASGA